YDGYHIAIYITNFSGPHEWLDKHGLVSEESQDYQYRFEKIVDPDTREILCVIEHEVRSQTHPMFLRPLVNRNPAQRQATYQRGAGCREGSSGEGANEAHGPLSAPCLSPPGPPRHPAQTSRSYTPWNQEPHATAVGLPAGALRAPGGLPCAGRRVARPQ